MNIQQLEQQIDSTIFSLKQKFSKNNLKTTNHSMPCSATTSPIPQRFNRTNSLKSIKSKNSFRKLIGGKKHLKEKEENIWTAPTSPQLEEQRNTPTTNSSLSTNNSPNQKRRNSARLRELQRLLKAYHEQNNKIKIKEIKESQNIQRKLSTYQSNNEISPICSSTNLLEYSKTELGKENPFIIKKEEEENNLEIKRKSGLEAQKQRQRMTLSELELALKGNEEEEKEEENLIIYSSFDSLEITKELNISPIPSQLPPKPPRKIKYLIKEKEEKEKNILIEKNKEINFEKNLEIPKENNFKKKEKHFIDQQKISEKTTKNKEKKEKTKTAKLFDFNIFGKQKGKEKQRNEKEILKTASSEPRLLLLSSPIQKNLNIFSRPGSPINFSCSSSPLLEALSLSLSNFAIEHLEKLKEFVTETKYVTAVFESRGGLNSIIEDTENELIHWMGINSKLLAVACEVHWSVPERFRSRQMDIKLKECLHAALRENNRRILGLNSCYENIVDPWNKFNISPFPLVLAKSRTEESCARDADTDSFQGIYRRFYPALLSLQDQSTVDAHKGYWTLENMRDETKSPLIPNPAKFLFHQSQEQLNRRSVVALNLAVLRLRGDNRDYDNDEKRIKNKEMKQRKSIVQSNF